MATPPFPIAVRDATDADMDAVTAIYAHHVRHGTASYETRPPTTDEMRRRRDSVLADGLPWLVATAAGGDDGRLLGYAYAALFHGRVGWRYTVEDSIYIAENAQNRGVGRALLMELVRRCEAAGKRQMIGVVGDSRNTASIALHAACGFEQAGLLKATGWKFGRWIDTIYMQRALGPGSGAPADDG